MGYIPHPFDKETAALPTITKHEDRIAELEAKLAARDEALKVAREALEETGLRWQSIVSALAKIEELIAK